MEMARMLSTARSGRAVRLPAIMRSGENFGSSSSVISSVMKSHPRKTVSPVFCAGQRAEGRKSLTRRPQREKAQNTQRRASKKLGGAIWSTSSAEVQKKYFGRVKFSTQVLKTLCKRGVEAKLTCRPFNSLMRFAQFLCNARTAPKIFAKNEPKGVAKWFVWTKYARGKTFCGNIPLLSRVLVETGR